MTTTTTTPTTIRTTPTQTTILTSMLFHSESEDMKESDESLETMLFKDEEKATKSTPRLPKVSQENFATTTDISIEVTLAPVTQIKNVTSEAAENMMQDQPKLDHHIDLEHFEYVENGIEEDKKYLESAIAIPRAEESEPNEIINYHDDATDFDELLARTQESTLGKNARSLDLNHHGGYNSAVGLNVQSATLLLSCCSWYTVRWIFA